MYATFRALSNPGYRVFWLATLFSNLGSAVQEVAQGWIVLELTGSALWLGVIAACARIPFVVLSPIGGVLADRFDRNRLLAIAQVLRMVPVTALAAVVSLGWAQPWHFAVAAIGLGIGNALNAPTASVMIKHLTRDLELESAIALQSAQFQISRALGPLLATGVFVLAGVVYGFHVNAISFVPLLWFALSRGRVAATVPRPRISMTSALKQGLRYVLSDPVVRVLLIATTAAIALLGSHVALFPVISAQLGTGVIGTAYLTGATGAGSLVGALLMPAAIAGRGWRSVLTIAGVVGGAGISGLAWAPNLSLACVLAFVASVAATTFLTTTVSVLQRRAADHLRGRVMSFYFLAVNAGLAAGSIAVGSIASTAGGTQLALSLTGGIAVALTPVLVFAARRAGPEP
jgi:MFS family permease